MHLFTVLPIHLVLPPGLPSKAIHAFQSQFLLTLLWTPSTETYVIQLQQKMFVLPTALPVAATSTLCSNPFPPFLPLIIIDCIVPDALTRIIKPPLPHLSPTLLTQPLTPPHSFAPTVTPAACCFFAPPQSFNQDYFGTAKPIDQQHHPQACHQPYTPILHGPLYHFLVSPQPLLPLALRPQASPFCPMLKHHWLPPLIKPCHWQSRHCRPPGPLLLHHNLPHMPPPPHPQHTSRLCHPLSPSAPLIHLVSAP